ncbi:hypothetical protein VPH35_134705 [Triticum aestivum]
MNQEDDAEETALPTAWYEDTMPKYLKRTNALLSRYSLRRLGTWSAPCNIFFLGCRPKRGKVFLWTCLKGS